MSTREEMAELGQSALDRHQAINKLMLAEQREVAAGFFVDLIGSDDWNKLYMFKDVLLHKRIAQMTAYAEGTLQADRFLETEYTPWLLLKHKRHALEAMTDDELLNLLDVLEMPTHPLDDDDERC